MDTNPLEISNAQIQLESMVPINSYHYHKWTIYRLHKVVKDRLESNSIFRAATKDNLPHILIHNSITTMIKCRRCTQPLDNFIQLINNNFSSKHFPLGIMSNMQIDLEFKIQINLWIQFISPMMVFSNMDKAKLGKTWLPIIRLEASNQHAR